MDWYFPINALCCYIFPMNVGGRCQVGGIPMTCLLLQWNSYKMGQWMELVRWKPGKSCLFCSGWCAGCVVMISGMLTIILEEHLALTPLVAGVTLGRNGGEGSVSVVWHISWYLGGGGGRFWSQAHWMLKIALCDCGWETLRGAAIFFYPGRKSHHHHIPGLFILQTPTCLGRKVGSVRLGLLRLMT